MQHRQLRSDRSRPRYRKTSPVRSLGATSSPILSPGSGDARPSFHQPRHNGESSLQEASFRQAQVLALAENTPLGHLALEEKTGQTRSLAEKALPQQLALEGETSPETSPKHPSAGFNQLDLAQLEQKMLKIEMLQKELRELVRNKLPSTLAAKLAKNECKQEVDCKQSSDNNNNNNDNNNNNNTTTTTTNQQQQQ